jgi:hydrogenase/urease accessory protein HupE
MAARTFPSCAAALVVLFLAGSGLQGHEIGTTRVSVLFPQERYYEIEIVTDAAALAEKLVPPGDPASAAALTPDRLQSLLRGAAASFRKRVSVAFDDREAVPEMAFSVKPASDGGAAMPATIRLTGRIPESAGHFTWSYGWTFASYALSIRSDAAGAPATEWLEGRQRSTPFRLAAPEPRVPPVAAAWRYLTLGFTHIVPHGLDHMLFVLGIYLLGNRSRSILWQVSAFTAAHSITLGLSIYGVLAVPPRIVEPLIAVSIAYVAVENLFLSELRAWRLALVFAFGLLHGMGFAGVLQELRLPPSEFLTALLSFNLGIEAGQLAVIGAAFLLVGWHCAHREWYRSRVVVPASMLIACVAVYWTVERLSL